MVAPVVHRAFEKKVCDLTSAGSSLRPLTEALASADETGLLERYRELSGGSAVRHRSFELAAFENAPAGSLGASIVAAAAGKERIDAFEIWRAVLGYGGDLLSTCRLNAFSASQNKDFESTLWIPVLLARAAFVDPEASLAIGDALAAGWLEGRRVSDLGAVDWSAASARPLADLRVALSIDDVPEASAPLEALALLSTPSRAPTGLWPAYWKAAGSPIDPGTITPLVASLGGAFDDRLKEACARAVLQYPGQREIADAQWWPRLEIESLREHPEGTLGHAYYHLIVDNGYDPEVLDPDSVSGFHAILDASNRRILQTHEVWHLIAGYSTSPLHEVAISGFQLAQFGHNYSAMFLATSTTLLALHLPMFLDPILQVTFEGWQHGRETCPLMPIDWFSLWGEDIGALRERFAVEPFASSVPDFATAA